MYSPNAIQVRSPEDTLARYVIRECTDRISITEILPLNAPKFSFNLRTCENEASKVLNQNRRIAVSWRLLSSLSSLSSDYRPRFKLPSSTRWFGRAASTGQDLAGSFQAFRQQVYLADLLM